MNKNRITLQLISTKLGYGFLTFTQPIKSFRCLRHMDLVTLVQLTAPR
jgi:hypothetical protein